MMELRAVLVDWAGWHWIPTPIFSLTPFTSPPSFLLPAPFLLPPLSRLSSFFFPMFFPMFFLFAFCSFFLFFFFFFLSISEVGSGSLGSSHSFTQNSSP